MKRYNSNSEMTGKPKSELKAQLSKNSWGNLSQKSGEYFLEAEGLVAAGDKFAGLNRVSDAKEMYEKALEILLETAKIEVDSERILKCYFRAFVYGQKLIGLWLKEEKSEFDLKEFLTANGMYFII